MKKIIAITGCIIYMSIVLPACQKFTEITPKGANILNRVSDLDLLLNYNFSSGDANSAQTAFSANDAGNLVNDTYAYTTNIPSLIAARTQDLNYAYTVYDASIDRKTLAVTDAKYEKMYFIINNVCNVILRNADNATGDRQKASQYKAEAYILRAYMHYMLVNLYAKAYDPATAVTDPGIPYVKEDNIISEPNRKSTVAEVYDNIQADIAAAFQLNSLPRIPANNMRTGQAFAYGVKALVLLNMRKHTEALEAAGQSLSIDSVLHDDRLYAPVGTAAFVKPVMTPQENLFYMGAGGSPTVASPSIEITSHIYEPGNIVNSYVKPYYALDNPFSGIAGSKLWLSQGGVYAINTAGLTTSDTYLIRAECHARSGNLNEALRIINKIRERRIHPNDFTPVSANTTAGVMALLMRNSRIECLYTMRNYFNIKRWNTEPDYQQTITRTVNGVTYSLTPDSPLWIFPFPQSATNYNNELTQNY